jgi:hypothetical protein
MTKKHFIALADKIREASHYRIGAFSDHQIDTLADFCQSQNAHFNRSRWIGYIKGGKVKQAT